MSSPYVIASGLPKCIISAMFDIEYKTEMRVEREDKWDTQEICFLGAEANAMLGDIIGTPVTGVYEFIAAYCQLDWTLLQAHDVLIKRLSAGTLHMEHAAFVSHIVTVLSEPKASTVCIYCIYHV